MARGYQPYSAFAADDARRNEEERAVFEAAQNGTLDPNSSAYRHAKLNGWVGGGQVQSNAAMDFSGGGDFTPSVGERVGDAGWGELNMANGEAQANAFGQMSGIVDRAVELNDARKTGAFNTFAGLIRLAEQGKLLPQALEYGNRSLGFDGVSQGIVAAGKMPNGDFSFRVASKGRDGKVSFNDNVIPAEQVLGIKNASSIFSNEDVDAARQELLKGGRFSEDEVNGFANRFVGKPGMFNRAEATARSGGGTDVSSWFRGQRTRSSISAFGSNGNGGTTQYYSGPETGFQLQQNDTGTRRQPTLQERIAKIQVEGQRAKADADMKAKMTLAQMQQQGYAARNAAQLAGQMANANSRVQSAQIAADARGGARAATGASGGSSSRGASGGPTKDMIAAIMQGDPMYERDDDGNVIMVKDKDGKDVPKLALDAEGKPVYGNVSWDEVLKRVKQYRDQEANAAAGGKTEVISPVAKSTEPQGVERDANGNLPRQELVKYRDADGRLVSANGYIRNGKVYDGNGNPVDGAMTEGAYADRLDKAARLKAAEEAIAKNRAARAAEGGAKEPAEQTTGKQAVGQNSGASVEISAEDRESIAKYRKSHPALKNAKDEAVLKLVRKNGAGAESKKEGNGTPSTAQASSQPSAVSRYTEPLGDIPRGEIPAALVHKGVRFFDREVPKFIESYLSKLPENGNARAASDNAVSKSVSEWSSKSQNQANKERMIQEIRESDPKFKSMSDDEILSVIAGRRK